MDFCWILHCSDWNMRYWRSGCLFPFASSTSRSDQSMVRLYSAWRFLPCCAQPDTRLLLCRAAHWQGRWREW